MSDPFRLYSVEEAVLGREGYPPEWDSIDDGPGIKHLARAAADDRCVRCRHPYESGMGEWSLCDAECQHLGPVRFLNAESDVWLEMDLGEFDSTGMAENIGRFRREARWRILTVHHLTGEKRDCRWWNLAPLCQRCHLLIQRKVVMRRPWPWEHSDWFKPYVAGFYAWRYRELDLPRDEVMRRLDELLVLGMQQESVERMPL